MWPMGLLVLLLELLFRFHKSGVKLITILYNEALVFNLLKILTETM